MKGKNFPHFQDFQEKKYQIFELFYHSLSRIVDLAGEGEGEGGEGEGGEGEGGEGEEKGGGGGIAHAHTDVCVGVCV